MQNHLAFFQGVLYNEITDDNGKVWLCADIQDMKIKRNGQEIIVKGSEIQESDEIVDYAG